MDDDLLMIGTDIDHAYEEDNLSVTEEVDVINKDRLILIKLYTTLISESIERSSRGRYGEEVQM